MDEDLASLGELGCPWASILTSEPLLAPTVEWAHSCEGDVGNTLVGVWFVESATLPCPHHPHHRALVHLGVHAEVWSGCQPAQCATMGDSCQGVCPGSGRILGLLGRKLTFSKLLGGSLSKPKAFLLPAGSGAAYLEVGTGGQGI